MDDILADVIVGLSERYDTAVINAETNFISGGTYIRVSYVEELGGIVVEYAENEEDAKNGRYEDGDTHSGDDSEQILQEIIEEIEG